MSVKTTKSMASRLCPCIGSFEVPDHFENITTRLSPEPPRPCTFSEDARWKPDRQALDLEVRIGEYYGVVRVSRREFQCLLLERSTLERWVEGVLPPADPFRKHRRGRYVGCT